jgi:hypothetical protein
MNRVQRYHRNHARLSLAVAIIFTLAMAAFDAAVLYAWFVG